MRIIVPELFALIPRYLFEQIKEADDESIDIIRNNISDIMTVPVMNEAGQVVGALPKPNVWMALLYDADLGIKGFLWAEFDRIDKCTYIQAASLDPEYQTNKGSAFKKVVDYIRSLPVMDELKSSIKLGTLTPRVYERFGWKRTKKVLMEYDMEFDNESAKTGEQSVPDGELVGQTEQEVQ